MLRSSPGGESTGSLLKSGEQVTVLSNDGTWARIKTDRTEGYALTRFLVFPEPSATSTPTATPTASPAASPTATPAEGNTATIVLSSDTSRIYIRSAASTSSTAVALLKHGTVVTTLGVDGAWTKIAYGDTVGYMSTSKLNANERDVKLNAASALLKTAASGAETVATLAKDQTVLVLACGETYTKVRAGDKEGYVLTSALRYTMQTP